MGVLVVLIVVTLVVATVGSRLLGVRVPLRRALVTGLAGVAAGVFAGYLAGRHHQDVYSPAVVGAALVTAVVSAMLLMVLAELLARPARRDAGGGAAHPLRALRRTARSIRRYAELSRIVARHGLWRIAGGARADPVQLGRSLRRALEEAGPLFVKFGQMLSTRSDLLPEAVTAELAQLQDRVPPTPWSEVRAVLEAELGQDPAEVFQEVDPEAIASASLAQVHGATLLDGTSVVLKVQRPGIVEPVVRDLDMIRRLGHRLEARTDWARSLHVADLARGFADALGEELDFRVEARNIATVAAARSPHDRVRIPSVYADLSSDRLLVMERFDGVSLRDAGPEIERLGVDRQRLGRVLLDSLLRQILVHGTFHADPHPGNVLLLRSGDLGLIDFGSVGRIDVRQQAALQRLLVALALRDPAELYEAVSDLAATDLRHADELEGTLAAFMSRHLLQGLASDPAVVGKLVQLLATSGVAFPAAIGGVFRALVTLDGTIRTLAPGFDLATETEAIAREMAGEAMAPSSLRESASRELLTLLPMLRRLPQRVDRITADLAGGRLTTNLRLFSDAKEASFVTALVNRAVLGLLGSALGLMSVILLFVPHSPRVVGSFTVLELFGYIGLFFSVTLIFRVVLEVLNPRRRG